MEKDILSKINGYQVDYECEKCKNVEKVNIFPYINFSKNPEFYSKVKNLDIFKVKCSKCNSETIITFDTLVVNEVHKYFLYFLSNKENLEMFQNQIDYFMKVNFNEVDNFNEYKLRLTFDLNELIEKMTIFELSLDDRAIEILKLSIFDSKQVDENNVQLFFDGIENTDLIFLYFSNKEKIVKSVKISISFYNKIIEKVRSLKNEEKFEIIDLNWAKNQISDK